MIGVTIHIRSLRSLVTFLSLLTTVPIILLQHCYCTFVIVLCVPFTWLFINLTMCIRALFTKSATTLRLVEQAFWRVPLFTEWVDASAFEVILGDFFLWDFGFSTLFFHSAAWKNLEKNSAVSFLHVYLNRDGNFDCLLWNTVRWISIANKLQEFIVHAVLSLDSWPRRFFHNFRSWR